MEKIVRSYWNFAWFVSASGQLILATFAAMYFTYGHGKRKRYSPIGKMKFDGASDGQCVTGERKVDKEWTRYIARKKVSAGAKSFSGSMDGWPPPGVDAARKRITLALEPAMRLAYSCAGYLEFSGV